jgi:hypothetical protein
VKHVSLNLDKIFAPNWTKFGENRSPLSVRESQNSVKLPPTHSRNGERLPKTSESEILFKGKSPKLQTPTGKTPFANVNINFANSSVIK